VLEPELALDRGVRVVGEEARRDEDLGLFAECSEKVHLLAEFGFGASELPAVDERGLLVGERRRESGEPLRRSRDGVSGDDGNVVAGGVFDADVERVAESEVFGANLDEPSGAAARDVASVVEGAAVDHDRFEFGISLIVEGVEESGEMLLFIKGADNYRN